VVYFAVIPFAAEMLMQGGIPKRLIPGTPLHLGAFSLSDGLQLPGRADSEHQSTRLVSRHLRGTAGSALWAVFIFTTA